MYYLQSRYYDPKLSRFINADDASYAATQGHNLFAYCGNEPVIRLDTNGDCCIKTVKIGMIHLDVTNNTPEYHLINNTTKDINSYFKAKGYKCSYKRYTVGGKYGKLTDSIWRALSGSDVLIISLHGNSSGLYGNNGETDVCLDCHNALNLTRILARAVLLLSCRTAKPDRHGNCIASCLYTRIAGVLWAPRGLASIHLYEDPVVYSSIATEKRDLSGWNIYHNSNVFLHEGENITIKSFMNTNIRKKYCRNF